MTTPIPGPSDTGATPPTRLLSADRGEACFKQLLERS
jgi:hypothetical protein